MRIETIYVVSWFYLCESGGGIVRAFRYENDAQDMLQLLQSHSDKEFKLTPVDLYYGI